MIVLKKLIFAAAAVIFMQLFGIASYAADTSEILVEAGSGTVLSAENADREYPAGSMSKLMTVLLAAEKIKSGEISYDMVFVASEHANSMQGAQIWLMPGDEISVSELLKAVIIGNANDASAVLAEGIGGSEEAFTDMMNSRAAELGMTRTLYKNSSGYMSGGDKTTAADTAKLLCELSKHKVLRDIFIQRLEYIRDGNVQLVNSNPAALHFSGAAGFKSGSVGEGEDRLYYSAEGAERDSGFYIACVLGASDEEYAADRAFELIDTGFQKYQTVTPEIPQEAFAPIKVKNGRKTQLRTEVKSVGSMVIAAGTGNRIECFAALPEYVYAPVKRGDTVGQVLYYYDGEFAFAADITAAGTAEEKTVGYILLKMLKNTVKF